MAQEITLDGATYISSKRAAEITGYTQDYVGQLARGGKVDARRVSGLWYIKQDSLKDHKEKAEAYVPVPPQKEKIESASSEMFVGADGNNYVSAARGAEITGYNQDYIGQLAREGKIPSEQVGNRWFVNMNALKAHKAEKDRLLAAVQAESVGIRPRVQENRDDSSRKGSEEYELHFTYKHDNVSEAPLFPPVAHREAEQAIEEEQQELEESEFTEEDGETALDGRKMIPIHVVRAVSNASSDRGSLRAERVRPRRQVPIRLLLVVGMPVLLFGILSVVIVVNIQALAEGGLGGLLSKTILYQR